MSARCCANRPPPVHSSRKTGRSSPMLAVNSKVCTESVKAGSAEARGLVEDGKPATAWQALACLRRQCHMQGNEAVHSTSVPPTFKRPCAGGHCGPPFRT
eukprot:1597691-Amphidinium_carterae.3